MDVLTKAQRRKNMAQIRSRNSQAELILRRAIWKESIRYRLHGNIMGKPDILIKKYQIAIFVDGCFWHKCKKCFTRPLTNRTFWNTKINKNVARDRKVTVSLKKNGWIVLRFWEHAIKKNPQKAVDRIQNVINKSI